MTFCYFSCLGRYCFRPTSMAALSLSALARWFYPIICAWFPWGWIKKEIKMAHSKNWVFQNYQFFPTKNNPPQTFLGGVYFLTWSTYRVVYLFISSVTMFLCFGFLTIEGSQSCPCKVWLSYCAIYFESVILFLRVAIHTWKMNNKWIDQTY